MTNGEKSAVRAASETRIYHNGQAKISEGKVVIEQENGYSFVVPVESVEIKEVSARSKYVAVIEAETSVQFVNIFDTTTDEVASERMFLPLTGKPNPGSEEEQMFLPLGDNNIVVDKDSYTLYELPKEILKGRKKRGRPAYHDQLDLERRFKPTEIPNLQKKIAAGECVVEIVFKNEKSEDLVLGTTGKIIFLVPVGKGQRAVFQPTGTADMISVPLSFLGYPKKTEKKTKKTAA